MFRRKTVFYGTRELRECCHRVRKSAFLLEVIFKVSRDDMVQMDAVGACHVVSVAGIDEEVGVGVGIDAGAHEGEGVLGWKHLLLFQSKNVVWLS